MANKQSTIYYMIGTPGSGKSSYAEKINSSTGAVILSSDNLRKKLTGSVADVDTIPYAEIFEILKRKAEELIRRGENFIWDSGNTNVKHRIDDTTKWKEMGCIIKGVLMAVPKEVSEQRNESRDRTVPSEIMGKKWKRLIENPIDVSKELYDEVYIVDENGVEKKVYTRKINEDNENKQMLISPEVRFR